MLATVVAIEFVKRYRVVVSSGKVVHVYYFPGEMRVMSAPNMSPLVEWEEREALNMVWAEIREGR